MKKLSVILTGLIILFCFTCCSKTQDLQSTQPSVSQSETTASEISSQTEITQGEAFSDSGFFKIALMLTQDQSGADIKQGVQLAIDEINASGEMKFSLSDSYNTSLSYTYNDLSEEGVQFLISNEDSVTKATEKPKNMLHISLKDSSDKQQDNILSLRNNESTVGKSVADYVCAKFPTEKIGVIYQSDSKTYSEQIEDFLDVLQQKGVQTAFAESFTKNKAYDFSVQLSKALSSQVKALVLFTSKQTASLIIEQSDAMGFKPSFIGTDELKGIITLEGINRQYIDNTYIVTPFSLKSVNIEKRNFRISYKKAYGKNPGLNAAYGYDSVYIIYEALKNADIKKYSLSSDKICKKLTDSRDDFTFSGITGENMRWDSTGKISLISPVIVIKKGEYVS